MVKWLGSARNAGPAAPDGSSSCAAAAVSATRHDRPSARLTPLSAHHDGTSFGPSVSDRSKPFGSFTSWAQPCPRAQPLLASRFAAEASASAGEPQMSGLPSPWALTEVVRNVDGRIWVWPMATAHEPL